MSGKEQTDEELFLKTDGLWRYQYLLFANLDADPIFQLMPIDVKDDVNRTLSDIYGIDLHRSMSYQTRMMQMPFTKKGKTVHLSVFARVEKDKDQRELSGYIKKLNSRLRKVTGLERIDEYNKMVKLFYDKILCDFNYPEIGKDELVSYKQRASRSSKVEMPKSTDDERPSSRLPSPAKEMPSKSTADAAKIAKKILTDKTRPDDEPSQQQLEAAGVKAKETKKTAASKKETPTKKTTITHHAEVHQAPKKVPPPPKKDAPKKDAAKAPNPPVNTLRKSTRQTKRAISPVSISDSESQGSVSKKKKTTAYDAPATSRGSSKVPSAPPSEQQSSDDDFVTEKERTKTTEKARSREAIPRRSTSPTRETLNQTFGNEIETADEFNVTFGDDPSTSTAVTSADQDRRLYAHLAQFAVKYQAESETSMRKILKEFNDASAKEDKDSKKIIKELKEFYNDPENPIRKDVKKLETRLNTQSIQIGKLVASMSQMTSNFNLLTNQMLKALSSMKQMGDSRADMESRGAFIIGQLFPLDVMGKCADVIFASHFAQEMVFAFLKQHLTGLASDVTLRHIAKIIFESCFNQIARGHLIIGEQIGAWKQIDWFKRPLPFGFMDMMKFKVMPFIIAYLKSLGREMIENFATFKTVISNLCSNGRTRVEEIAALGSSDDDDFIDKLLALDTLYHDRNKHSLPANKQTAPSREDYIKRIGARTLPRGGKPVLLDYPKCFDVVRDKSMQDDLSVYDTLCVLCVSANETGRNWRKLTFEKTKFVEELPDEYQRLLRDHPTIATIVDHLKDLNIYTGSDGNTRDFGQKSSQPANTQPRQSQSSGSVEEGNLPGASTSQKDEIRPHFSLKKALRGFQSQQVSPMKKVYSPSVSPDDIDKKGKTQPKTKKPATRKKRQAKKVDESDTETEEETTTDESRVMPIAFLESEGEESGSDILYLEEIELEKRAAEKASAEAVDKQSKEIEAEEEEKEDEDEEEKEDEQEKDQEEDEENEERNNDKDDDDDQEGGNAAEGSEPPQEEHEQDDGNREASAEKEDESSNKEVDEQPPLAQDDSEYDPKLKEADFDINPINDTSNFVKSDQLLSACNTTRSIGYEGDILTLEDVSSFLIEASKDYQPPHDGF